MACSGFNALKLIILLFDFLGQLPEFCSRDSSLVVKEIFGVTEYASILNFGLFGSHKETKELKLLQIVILTHLTLQFSFCDTLKSLLAVLTHFLFFPPSVMMQTNLGCTLSLKLGIWIRLSRWLMVQIQKVLLRNHLLLLDSHVQIRRF